MKIIKFRAWNKKSQKMSAPFTLFELAVPLSQKGFIFATEGDDLEIMQFTGLIDKSGTEVYEGDILKGLKGGGEKYQCYYDEEEFQFKIKNTSLRRVWQAATVGLIILSSKEFKVIGNIYEGLSDKGTKK